MVIKVKEITISRGRKFAWNYGNDVGFGIGTTVEGTTAKDTLEDMRKVAIEALNKLEVEEQTRCKDVMDIADLKAGMEFKQELEDTMEQIKQEPAVRRSSPGFKSFKEEPQFKEEKLEVTEEKTIITEVVLMDPHEVTIIMKTPKSLLVTKKGFQKWIAFSLMEDINEDSYEIGEYIEVLTIKDDKRKWFNEVKGWDKLEVRKS